jgi:hypothetical protein
MSVRPLARTEGSMIAKEIISEDLRKRKAFLWRLLDLITSKIPRKSAEHFMPKSKYDCAELQTFPCNKFPTCCKESSALNTPGNIIDYKHGHIYWSVPSGTGNGPGICPSIPYLHIVRN